MRTRAMQAPLPAVMGSLNSGEDSCNALVLLHCWAFLAHLPRLALGGGQGSASLISITSPQGKAMKSACAAASPAPPRMCCRRRPPAGSCAPCTAPLRDEGAALAPWAARVGPPTWDRAILSGSGAIANLWANCSSVRAAGSCLRERPVGPSWLAASRDGLGWAGQVASGLPRWEWELPGCE